MQFEQQDKHNSNINRVLAFFVLFFVGLLFCEYCVLKKRVRLVLLHHNLYIFQVYSTLISKSYYNKNWNISSSYPIFWMFRDEVPAKDVVLHKTVLKHWDKINSVFFISNEMICNVSNDIMLINKENWGPPLNPPSLVDEGWKHLSLIFLSPGWG